ncbi:MAG: alpha/beta hydrolase [Pseudomonadota bacterium]
MSIQDRIDPQSRKALEALLTVFPGGINATVDIVKRREKIASFAENMAQLLPPVPEVEHKDHMIPSQHDGADFLVRVYTPKDNNDTKPGILYIHGGGMVIGSVQNDHFSGLTLCRDTNAVVVSVDYRLAPENPHPIPSTDCYSALCWMAENAQELEIDPKRIAVFGQSAGGGLTLATTLMARDRSGPDVCFQMPIYPMIDDRNETPSSYEITDIGIWDRAANLQAWEFYLRGKEADQYAAPARCEDLSGLPPTFIDVGDLDAFRDENITFVQRLAQAGVPTEFRLYPGAFHASEVFTPDADLSQRIWARRIEVLNEVLHG